jgi:hypothetical protein
VAPGRLNPGLLRVESGWRRPFGLEHAFAGVQEQQEILVVDHQESVCLVAIDRRASPPDLPFPKPPGYDSLSSPVLQRLAAAGAFASLALDDKPASAIAVPKSFLGLSLDLNDIEGVAHPEYIKLVKKLTSYDTGPM